MSSTTSLDSEWADALNEVYDTELESTAPSVEEPKEEEEETPEEDTPKEETPEEETPKEETPEEEPPVEEEAAKEEPASDVKSAIKEALREMNEEQHTTEVARSAITKEVLETLYPEGIDRQLKDSDGDPITGIDDLMKLINPKTNDYFTEEEAGSWLLASQKTLNETIEKMENYAESVAETHLSLKEGSERVEQVYGDLLESMPEVADKVLAAYQATLVKDAKTGIVIKAPLDVVEFYDIALAGYKDMAQKMTVQKNAESEAEAKAAAEAEAAEAAEQADRGDIPATGSAKPSLTPEKQGWADALKSYYEV